MEFGKDSRRFHWLVVKVSFKMNDHLYASATKHGSF
jgi:hypothetical protein